MALGKLPVAAALATLAPAAVAPPSAAAYAFAAVSLAATVAAKPAAAVAAVAPESAPSRRLHRKHCAQLPPLRRGGRRLVHSGGLH